MADNTIQCTVDLKKNRIRIHKETLRQMGNPRYVQFLVNEEKQVFAMAIRWMTILSNRSWEPSLLSS